MNRLFTIVLGLSLLTAPATSQNNKGSCIDEIFAGKYRDVLSGIAGYSWRLRMYHELGALTAEMLRGVDSLEKEINKSDFSLPEREAAVQLLPLIINEHPDDVYKGVRVYDASLVNKLNNHLPLATLYLLERKFTEQLVRTHELEDWARKLCDFCCGKTRDPNLDREMELYDFRRGDSVAYFGDTSGNFEKYLQANRKRLNVYVVGSDSIQLNELKSKLDFLQLKNKDRRVRFHYSVFTPLDESLDKFDKIIARNIFHHLSDPHEYLQYFKHSLKADGRLYITETVKMDTNNTLRAELAITRKSFLEYFTPNGFVLEGEKSLQFGTRYFEFRLKGYSSP